MADRNISLVVKDPLLKDIDSFSVSRNPGGTFEATVGYSLKDADGAVYKTGSCVVPLGASAVTALGNFLSTNCLTQIRSQEQM